MTIGAGRKQVFKVFGAATAVLFVLFIIAVLNTDTTPSKPAADPEQEIQASQEENAGVQEETVVPLAPRFEKVLSITGKDGKESEEFIIDGRDIKISYSCDEGLFVCTARLHQIAGEANEEIFRSAGSTGAASGEKVISAGPGRFFIDISTGDRNYVIDVFQSTILASEAEREAATAKISEAGPYRSVAGFKMTQERTFGDVQFYDYETGNGKYRVALTVNSPRGGDELEESYSLGRSSTEVGGVNAVYGFQEAAVINGVQVSQPYESLELIFKYRDALHLGIVRRSDNVPDKEGSLETMEAFIAALLASS